MKEIELSDGSVCMVDDCDYPFLSQWKWRTQKTGNNKYACRTGYSNGKSKHIRMHRMLVVASPEEHVDHADGNSLNNCRYNLRTCTRSENLANSKPRKRKKYSKYKGVSVAKDRTKKLHYWTARVSKDNETFYLGCFPTEEDAARAYNKKARELHGEFAKLNNI